MGKIFEEVEMITAEEARVLSGEIQKLENISKSISDNARAGFKRMQINGLSASNVELLEKLGYGISIIWDCGHVIGHVISWE